MKMTIPSKSQLTKYFLSKWYYLDNNINDLSEVETVQMKILYASLKTLNEDELNFLAGKYRVERKPYITDKDAALKQGMNYHTYRDRRLKIEINLMPVFKENVERFDKDLSKAVQLEHGR